MRILITTGIYPPQIGGPAQYAKNLAETFQTMGHKVWVATYNWERYLPSGLRHFWFGIKIIPTVWRAEKIVTLDTFSVGLPTAIVGRLLGKKFLIRIGGDFLWEQYVERTHKLVLLRTFYQTETGNFTLKEKIIFHLTCWVLRHAHWIVFNTDWQRQIWREPYQLNLARTEIIENYYGLKMPAFLPSVKNFLTGGRNLQLKNNRRLQKAFIQAKARAPDLKLEIGVWPPAEFMARVANCYAVVLVSISDVSPNLILDALRYNKPFIVTRETGLYEKLKDVGVFVDPLDEQDIADKIQWLAQKENYKRLCRQIADFKFTHTWQEIAGEFLHL